MKRVIRQAWAASPALVATAAGHLVLLVVFLAGCGVDDRLIAGELAWVKPAKFAASIVLYTLTLAWMLSFAAHRARRIRWLGRVTATAMWIETAIIALQAFRGVRSHFNGTTPLDGMLFTVMGVSILTATVAGFVAVWLLFRTPFEDRALGRAIRFGLLLSMLGASLGGLMTRPRSDQLELLAAGTLTEAGAHSVGVADGGPGLPVVGWSTAGGDLRVPHFLGLHAMQLLPLFALLLLRARKSPRLRERLVGAAAFAHAGTVAALTWQALRAEPLLSPGVPVLVALGAVWFGAIGWSVAGTRWRSMPPRRLAGAGAPE